MKEDKKTKKTTAKKAATKKVALKKTTVAKKNVNTKTSVKKAPVKKKTTAPKKTVASVEPKTELVEKVEEIKKESERNNELTLRAVLVVAYTLVILILVIGFIEPQISGLKVSSNYKPAYLVQEEILEDNHVLSLNNAWSTLSKLEGDYFVYVGYTKMYNSDVQVLDMGIANLIDKYGLKDKFYYLNIDSIINKKDKVNLVNYYLGYRDVLVTKVPTIIYVNSENIVRPENIITREDDKLLTIGDFQKLLDINQFVVKK